MLYGQTDDRGAVNFMVLPLSGEGKPQPLGSWQFGEGLSKFSPDGRWIAYFSGQSGRSEIYVQPYPERSSKLLISTQGGNYPRWARSGKELFYMTDDGVLMAVDVRADGSTLHASAPRVLFKTAAILGDHYGLNYPYDTIDGQRFIINERLAPASQGEPLTVVLNWTAGLKK